MEDMEKVQKIGDSVCEGYFEGQRDCGIEPEDCSRIAEAIDILNDKKMNDEDEYSFETAEGQEAHFTLTSDLRLKKEMCILREMAGEDKFKEFQEGVCVR